MPALLEPIVKSSSDSLMVRGPRNLGRLDFSGMGIRTPKDWMGSGSGDDEREKKDIIADLHVHLSSKITLDKLLGVIGRDLIGIAAHEGKPNILNWYQAMNLLGEKAMQIDDGLLAAVRNGNKMGYIAHVQEILSDYHILAIGMKGLLPTYPDARKTVEEIHKKGGLAVLAHPCVVGWLKIAYRAVKPYEEGRIRELMQMVDQVETFNAQNIWWMKKANRRAAELAKEYGHKGISSSDTHVMLDQPKRSSTRLELDEVDMENILTGIKQGGAERFENHVSSSSFILGHLLCRKDEYAAKLADLFKRGWAKVRSRDYSAQESNARNLEE